ncbi:MAG: hydrogenase/urease maturation nickel metallochaperone HypA [Parvibaculaceae bacterium]
MHEASLTNNLIHKIEEVATREKASRVTKVDVWLGALSHMSPGHFREHYAAAAAGTIAEGAELVIETSDDIHHSEAEHVLLRRIETEE